MKITVFKNMKGLIHGADSKRISSDKGGTLKIGKALIKICPGEDSVMPLLFNGNTGDYDATFITDEGVAYALEKVEVRDGRINPPSRAAMDLMELRLRTDEAEVKIEELSQIFDTNSLNFLIK